MHSKSIRFESLKIVTGEGGEINENGWKANGRGATKPPLLAASSLSLLIQMIQTQRYARSSTILTSGVCRRQLLFRRNKLPRTAAAAAALCHALSTRSMTDILMPCPLPPSPPPPLDANFSVFSSLHTFSPPIR